MNLLNDLKRKYSLAKRPDLVRRKRSYLLAMKNLETGYVHKEVKLPFGYVLTVQTDRKPTPLSCHTFEGRSLLDFKNNTRSEAFDPEYNDADYDYEALICDISDYMDCSTTITKAVLEHAAKHCTSSLVTFDNFNLSSRDTKMNLKAEHFREIGQMFEDYFGFDFYVEERLNPKLHVFTPSKNNQ